ncbi:MAG: ester cyclase [Chloroflexota bacterium]
MATVDQEMRNLEAVRRWTEEGENRRNAAVVDELMAPDFESHALFYNPYVPSRMQGGSWTERVKQNIDKDIAGLDDRHTTLDQTIAAGDKVVTVATTSGMRNGKQVSYCSISITRFADGKMVETWFLWDRLGLYQQLGVLPETPVLLRQAGLET